MTGARSCLSKLAAAAAIALLPLAVSIQPARAQAPAGFAVHESPRPVPEIQFENGRGEAMSLADFRGKVVLLNIWAT
jgi:cytochrome oxidase Cu insertion factor (SCO1/SenC/PrrC family)